MLVIPQVQRSLGNLPAAQPVGQQSQYRPLLLPQQADARVTWKWGLAMQRASCWKSGTWNLQKSTGDVTSSTSSISFRNITSLMLFVLGQTLSSPVMIYGARVANRTTVKSLRDGPPLAFSTRVGSFSANWTTQKQSWVK